MSDTQETAPQEGPASLREALIESFNEHSGDAPAEPDSTETAPTDDEPQLDASDEQEAEAESSEAEAQDEPEVIQAPEHWSDEDQATFTALPREAQEYLLKREKQYEQGIQSKSEQIKPIDEAFQPYDEYLKLRGVDRATAIRSWVAAQQLLDSDPVKGFKMLIQTYGPDLAEKLKDELIGQSAPADDDYSDPEIRKLREELDRQKQSSQQVQTQYEQLRQQEALEQVRQFREAKDDTGSLLHPHFEAAQNAMRALLSSGVAPDLQSAYDMAIKTLPEYEQQLAEQLKAKAEKQEADKRAKAAERAKKASKAVNGKGSKPPPPAKAATLRDDLAAAWDQSLRGEL